tara:strand:- start:2215 stop:2406 length:192 start_codon:yes stop_codon:yes gene_type:complete
MSLENKLGMYLTLSIVLILSGILLMIVSVDFEMEPILYLISRVTGFSMMIIGARILRKHFINY